MPDLVTIKDLARELNVSNFLIHRLIKRDILQTVNGLVTRESVNDLKWTVASHQAEAA